MARGDGIEIPLLSISLAQLLSAQTSANAPWDVWRQSTLDGNKTYWKGGSLWQEHQWNTRFPTSARMFDGKIDG